jgi:hypothetical protein
MSSWGARVRPACAALFAVLSAAPGGGARETAAGAPAVPAPTVAFELFVQDARGRPVTDVRLEEVEVIQDATRQTVRTFRAGARAGLYEVTYAPLSGRAGGVTARVTRRGTVARGPDGPVLKPRILSALTPLEAELTRHLVARTGASDLRCDVAVYRFERGPAGTRHTVAVEIPLSELRFGPTAEGPRGQLQVLARFTPAARPDGRQHVTANKLIELAGGDAISVQRLVWTGTVSLGTGRHTVDVLVRDAAADRTTTRTLEIDVPPPLPGISSSSVVLLRPRTFFFMRDQAEGDDPLVHDGVPLMPSLRNVLPARAESYLRFFVALYPARGSADPVVLTAEVLRDGVKVGEGPIELPKADEAGRISYVGLLPTASFRPGSYALRLVARQGTTAVAEESPFSVE